MSVSHSTQLLNYPLKTTRVKSCEMAEGGDDDLFVDFISYSSAVADVVDNAAVHAPDDNNNNSDTFCPNEINVDDLKHSSTDDFLFDPNFIEANVVNLAFLKTTHVTGLGVSCELVSGGVPAI